MIIKRFQQSIRPIFNKGYVFAFFVVVIWVGFILVSRIGGTSTLTNWDVIAIRYSCSSVILGAYWLYLKKPSILTVQNFILALFGGLIYACFVFYGFKQVVAGQSAILLAGTLPLTIAFVSSLMLRSYLTSSKLLGLIFIFLGVSCLFVGDWLEHATFKVSGLSLLVGSFSWATYTVLIKKWHADPKRTAIAVSLITTMLYLPIYILFLPKNIIESSISMIALQGFYQGFLATIVQMLLYIQATKLIGAYQMGIGMAFIPLFSGLFAVPLLGESFTVWLFVGGVCVLVGAWFSYR